MTSTITTRKTVTNSIRTLCCLLLMIGLWTTNANAQTFCIASTNAGTISNYTTVNQVTASVPAGFAYYWVTTLTAGVSYTFSNCVVDGGTAEDTYMRIYNSASTVMATADDICGVNPSLVYTPVTTGVYYVHLAHYSCAALSSSQIIAYKASVASPTFCTTSIAAGAISGYTGAFQLTPTVAVGGPYFWATTLTAGTPYTFSNCVVDGATAEDTYLRLYNAASTILASADDICGVNASFTYTPVTTATYYLLLSHYSCGALTSAQKIAYKAILCSTPTASAATSVTSSTATANWTCAGCAGSYIVEYGLTGFSPGLAGTAGVGGTVVTAIAGATSVGISGLSTGTSYQYYVRQFCGAGSYSSNSSVIAFTTACGGSPDYTVARTTGNAYNSIMSTGTTFSTLSSADDGRTNNISLTGTTFTFQGCPVTAFSACTNGWMTFNTALTSNAWTNDLTSTASTRVLAPFWDDLVLKGNTTANQNLCMRYQINGTLGSGTADIIMEWAEMERFLFAAPNLHFQVVLHESGNTIDFNYGDMQLYDGSTTTSLFSYSVGINGNNPAGTASTDRLILQREDANFFSSTNQQSFSRTPTCSSRLRFTPAAAYSGVDPGAPGVPSNNESATSIHLNSNPSPCTSNCGNFYTSLNATASASIPVCLGTPDDDVWFDFNNSTGSSSYKVTVNPSLGYNAVIQVLDAGNVVMGCVDAGGAGISETVTVPNTGTFPYKVRVYESAAGVGGNGEFAICVSDYTPPPVNDECAGATSLSVGTTCSATNSVLPNTLAATASAGIPVCSAGSPGTPDDDVWYKFTTSAIAGQSYTMTVTGVSTYNPVLQLLHGACGALTADACVNTTGNGAVETITSNTLLTSTVYYLRIYHAGSGAANGNFNVCVYSPAPACIASPSSPANAGTACSSSPVTLSWPAASGATGYDVYFNAGGVASTLVSSNQAGLTYSAGLLSLGGYAWRIVPLNGGTPSTGCSDWTFTVTPPPTAGTASGPGALFTAQNGSFSETGGSGTLTWKYGTVSGTWGTSAGSGNAQLISFPSPGTYYVVAERSGTGCTAVTSNELTVVVTVQGDFPCTPLALVVGTNGPYSNVGATVDAGEVAPPATGCGVQTGWCNSTLNNTLWGTFTAPASGRVSIAAPGWDNQLALYTVTACGNYLTYTLIAANDDNIGLTAKINALCVTPGATYYVQLDGYSTTGTTTIVIVDEGNSAPVIGACPGTITQCNDLGLCSAVVTYTAPTATDDCGATVVCSPASGSTFAAGTTSVTCTATDVVGATSACSFNVIVNDCEAPVITVPATNMTVECDGAGNLAAFNQWLINDWGNADATDNCNSAAQLDLLWTNNFTSFNYTCGNTGNSGTVRFYSHDVAGNQSLNTNATFYIVDTQAPVINCVSNIVQCDNHVATYNVTATDVCGATVVCVPASGSTFVTGTTTVNCTATDCGGNTANCSFTVTINETPVIVCPSTINDATSNPGGMTETYTAPSGGSPSATATCTPASGSNFPIGTTTVNCSATNSCGTGTCSFNVVIVNNCTVPVISACPANISQCDVYTATWTDPTATGNPTPTVACSPASGSTFAAGVTTVTCTATSTCGTDQCSFTVTINETPVISACPANISQCDNHVATWTNPTATGTPAATVSCSPASGSTFATGTTSVTCTATNSCGSSSCSFNVTINETPVISACPANISQCDNHVATWTDPTATGTPAATVSCSPASGSTFATGTTSVTCTATNSCGSSSCSFNVTINETPVISACPANISQCDNHVATWTTPTATGTPAATVSCSPASGSNFATGTTSVTCTATNSCGSSSCSFNVTINETPVISACPANISQCDNHVATWTTPTATGTPAATVTCVPASGSTFAAGTTSVTCTATNSCGSSSCSFNVTINDSPVIGACPSNITTCNPVVTFSTPTATGTPAPSVTCTPASGSTFALGTTSVTCTATNSCGSSSCSFTVNVQTPSVAATSATSNALYGQVCSPGSVTLTANGGSLGTGASWVWYDGGCGSGVSVGSGSPLTITPAIGSHNYFVRAEGACGNTACQSVAVSVITAPPSNTIGITAAPADGCVGAPAQTVSVNAVANCTFYNWSSSQAGVRFNGNPSPFQTTVPTVNVTFVSLPAAGSSGWSICVFGGNACGNTNTICTWVRATVSAPTSITGSVIGCPGTSGNAYSSSAVAGAATYQWSATGGIVITGNGAQAVTLAFPGGFVSGVLSVHGQTACGYNGPNRSMTITASPAIPGTISGSSYPCPNASSSYSIVAVPGAANYTWTTSVPGAVVTGTGTSCSIAFPTSIPAGSTVSVVANSSCPTSSPTRSKGIASGLPGVPFAINGPASGQCGQTGVSYTINPVFGATGYNWTASCGTIQGPNNLSGITIDWPASFTTCTLTVTASNSCGTGIARTLVVFGAPVIPAVIAGNAAPCANTPETYSTSSVGATSFNWVVPAGSLILGPANGPSINLLWGATSGNVTVTATNTCGTSGVRSLPCVISCRQSQVNGSAAGLNAEVYPNPATEKATVKFTAVSASQIHLNMTNVLGQSVMTTDVAATEGINMVDLDLSRIAKGVYQLSIMSGDNTEQIKLIVQ